MTELLEQPTTVHSSAPAINAAAGEAGRRGSDTEHSEGNPPRRPVRKHRVRDVSDDELAALEGERVGLGFCYFAHSRKLQEQARAREAARRYEEAAGLGGKDGGR